MKSTQRSRHRNPARRRPQLEGLEPRQLLATTGRADLLGPAVASITSPPSMYPATAPSSASLTVVQTDPADGASLTNSPVDISVTFDRPIDPFSLTDDLLLDRVAVDGSATPVFGS